jgi:hypothetical protein
MAVIQFDKVEFKKVPQTADKADVIITWHFEDTPEDRQVMVQENQLLTSTIDLFAYEDWPLGATFS